MPWLWGMSREVLWYLVDESVGRKRNVVTRLTKCGENSFFAGSKVFRWVVDMANAKGEKEIDEGSADAVYFCTACLEGTTLEYCRKYRGLMGGTRSDG